MPIPSTTIWPRPKSEDEWEDMVLDAMRILWNDPKAYRYGRRGQRQNGVDIIGKSSTLTVAAQAKNCDSLTKQMIKVEIEKVKKLFTKIDELYFVISGDRDTKLQEIVHSVSIENKARAGLEVFILFFDDVCQYLSHNSSLVKKYWQSFFDVVPYIFNKMVLTKDDAIDAIISSKEFQVLAKQIDDASFGKTNLSLRVESVPKLDDEADIIQRSWQIAVSENHETYIVTLCRFAINIDNGELYFYSVIDNDWFSRKDWEEKGNI